MSSNVKIVKRNSGNVKLIALLLYVIVGFVIAFTDPYVLPVYFTLLPLHALFLYFSLKTKNLPCILYCLFLFISHGLGSIPFYLNRKYAVRTGFGAIGDFDFSYDSLFSAYSYSFVFIVVLLLFAASFKKEYHSNFLLTFIRQQYNTITLHSTLSILPIVICSVLFSWFSLQMYYMNIGMIGLKQTELPFHLTGILFYTRRLLFPVVLIWLYVKTRAKVPATIVLILYALFIGITSTSKSACLLVLIPITLVCYLTGKKSLVLICSFFIVFSYIAIEDVRQIIYEFDANISIRESLQMTSLALDDDALFSFFGEFTNRFYGLQSNVLPIQIYELKLEGLVNYYTGTPISQVLPDFTYKIFGMNLPEDKAYGFGFGYTGSMTLLSCHNYFYSILQAVIISVLFIIQNDNIQRIVKKKGKLLYKYIALLILMVSYMSFHDGVSMSGVYLYTIALVLIRYKMSIR